MKQFRTLIFWCHLVAGVFAGLVVLVMSVTGVALTYQKQVTAWADLRGLDGSPPAANAARLPVATLVEKAQGSGGGPAPTAILWRADPNAPVQISFGRERTVFSNAYTGEVLGEGSSRVRGFFRVMTDWHRWLGGTDENRETGKMITGACNLAFLFIVASGFYLWWPRNWNRRALASVTLFRRGLSPKARDFNWHNVIGFWSVVPLFVVVLSGVVISYRWAGDLVYRAVGEQPPAPEGQGAGPQAAGGSRSGGRPEGGPGRGAQEGRGGAASAERTAGREGREGGGRKVSLAGIDGLVAQAERQIPGWRTLTLQVPRADDAPLRFTLDRGTGGQPQKRATLELDRATGEVLKWEPFSDATPGRRLRMILRFAHTGEVLGIAGQTIAGLVSLGAVFLVWTGLSLTLRRFQSWRRRKQEGRGSRRPSPREESFAEVNA
jgi:uncharacterized iron-regulated membrane protein